MNSEPYPKKIYRLEKFGMGYERELILNYQKKTIGFKETSERGYSNFKCREYTSIQEMMLYISRYFSVTDWRIVEVG